MTALLTSLLQSTVTMAVPLLLAALGELLAERAGVINIGLEGMLLTGAFAAMATTYSTAMPVLGLLAAWISGLLLALLFAYVVVVHSANQIVVGTALNLFAVGITGVAYRALFGVTGAALTVTGFAPLPLPFLSSLPMIGPAFCSQTILGYLAFVLVPVVAFGLYKTIPGLKLRMVGENPHGGGGAGRGGAAHADCWRCWLRRLGGDCRSVPRRRLRAHLRRRHVGGARLHRLRDRHLRPLVGVGHHLARRCCSVSPPPCSSTCKRSACPSRTSSS